MHLLYYATGIHYAAEALQRNKNRDAHNDRKNCNNSAAAFSLQIQTSIEGFKIADSSLLSITAFDLNKLSYYCNCR